MFYAHFTLFFQLERIFAQLIGESDYRLARIVRFSAGSVIVEGELQTANRIDDPEMLATKFEEQLAVEHRQLGANDVDLKSITVGGKYTMVHPYYCC